MRYLGLAAAVLLLFLLSFPGQGGGTAHADDEDSIQERIVPYLDIVMESAVQVTKLTQPIIQQEIAGGTTLAQIGAERGLYADFGPKFRQAALAIIDKKVASGDLHSESASEARELFTNSLDDIINAQYITDSAAAVGTAAPPDASAPNQAARRLKVVTTTIQVTALTRAVGGDIIELRGIVPAGADPHEFEPTASDLVAIERSDVILRNGLGIDEWLDGTLQAGANAQVFTVSKGVKLRLGLEDGKRVSDPHIWHDPDNAKVMTDDIATALASLDPADAGVFLSNAAAQKARLDAAKQQGQALVNQLAPNNRKLVTNHDAFNHFADAFGFQIVGAVIPSITTDAEPSARDTAVLLDTIKSQNVKAIFAESSVNPKLATSIAKDAGVKIVVGLYGDSLGKPGSGADTVEGMILTNIRLIVDSLK